MHHETSIFRFIHSLTHCGLLLKPLGFRVEKASSLQKAITKGERERKKDDFPKVFTSMWTRQKSWKRLSFRFELQPWVCLLRVSCQHRVYCKVCTHSLVEQRSYTYTHTRTFTERERPVCVLWAICALCCKFPAVLHSNQCTYPSPCPTLLPHSDLFNDCQEIRSLYIRQTVELMASIVFYWVFKDQILSLCSDRFLKIGNLNLLLKVVLLRSRQTIR